MSFIYLTIHTIANFILSRPYQCGFGYFECVWTGSYLAQSFPEVTWLKLLSPKLQYEKRLNITYIAPIKTIKRIDSILQGNSQYGYVFILTRVSVFPMQYTFSFFLFPFPLSEYLSKLQHNPWFETCRKMAVLILRAVKIILTS